MTSFAYTSTTDLIAMLSDKKYISSRPGILIELNHRGYTTEDIKKEFPEYFL